MAQLDAMRYDLDGDGAASDNAYAAAFPRAVAGMGCPAGGCAGYELVADLDFDTNGNGRSDAGDAYWNDGAGWLPIGDGSDNALSTTFDGGGHTIANLYMNREAGKYFGLFGYSSGRWIKVDPERVTIRRLGLVSVNVKAVEAVGGLVGMNGGTITDSYVVGTVSGTGYVGGLAGRSVRGAIVDSHAAGNVYSGRGTVGGLVGDHYGGTISGSHSTADVSSNSRSARLGGLVGQSHGAHSYRPDTKQWYVDTVATITNSYAAGNVSGCFDGDTGGCDTGGLVGSIHEGATIVASYAAGNVSGCSGSDTDGCVTGGLVGRNSEGTIIAGYATGTVSGCADENGSYCYSGSLVGTNIVATIIASYSTGTVAGFTKGRRGEVFSSARGGLVGKHSETLTGTQTHPDGSKTVRELSGGFVSANSYWDTNTSGLSSSAGGTGKTTAELQAPTGYTGIYAGWNVDLDNADGDDDLATGGDDPWDFGTSNDYPNLKGVAAGAMRQPEVGNDYDGDDDGLIEVGNLAQLDAIRYDLDGDGAASDNAYAAAFPRAVAGMGCPAGGCAGYELVADLDFDTNGNGRPDAGEAYWNGGAGWDPIGADFSPFNATFEGNDFTISSLYINRGLGNRGYRRQCGLFFRTGRGSHLRLVSLESVSVSAYQSTGALVGVNEGTVTASYATGSVSGDYEVGGLVGENWGTVTGSYATGSVSGSSKIGGLAGQNRGTVTASYATGNVSGSFISIGGLAGRNLGVVTASYATGSVSGGNETGGLVGENRRTVTASYATGNVSGNRSVGGLVGVNDGTVAGSYTTGSISGSGDYVGGLVGSKRRAIVTGTVTATVTASYWDTEASGQSASAGGEGKTTQELQSPTDYAGIYATWNIDVDNADADNDLATGGDDPWDFGTSSQYPRLKRVGPGSGTQSAAAPVASGDRAILETLYNATGGTAWTRSDNWLSDELMKEWDGVTTDEQGQVIGLDLGSNGLAGTIPPELGQLDYLQWLDLSGNRLSGAIPEQLGGLGSLIVLDLSDNQLTGGIPTDLSNLSNLTRLNLSRNWLAYPTGAQQSSRFIPEEIPADLARLKGLRALNLSYNGFVGTIPDGLGTGNDTLETLDLSHNALTGTIPAQLGYSGYFSGLQTLWLNDNLLSGPLPPGLGELEYLRSLNLSGNKWLHGPIPAGLDSLANLRALFLSGNRLSGCIPDALSDVETHDLDTLDQPFCADAAPVTPVTPTVRVNDNDKAALKVFYEAVGYDACHDAVDAAASVADLPEDCGVKEVDEATGRVTSLWLPDKGLAGDIPPTAVSKLTELRTLHLPNNSLTGRIPEELGQLEHLQWLDLSHNRMEGAVPKELGQLKYLSWLDLSNNADRGKIWGGGHPGFSGNIPSELGNLSNLNWLDLSNNSLTGDPADALLSIAHSCNTYNNGIYVCGKESGIGVHLQGNQWSVSEEEDTGFWREFAGKMWPLA